MYNFKLTLPQIFAALASFLLFAAAWLHASSNPPEKHMGDHACASCHLAGDKIDQGNAHLLVAAQEKLCASCHPQALQASHPSGMRPALTVPPTYPLDWKGDMTCSTCHNVHSQTPGLMRGTARGRNLCLACHDQQFFDKMADQGVSMISSGHMAAKTAKVDLDKLGIDAYTVQCMSCHGSYGDLNGSTIDAGQILRHAGNAVNHPIGRLYSESFKKGKYKPEFVVNQRLFLPDGKLSCVSCHLGYAKDHGKLRVGKRGSALCFECHDI